MGIMLDIAGSLLIRGTIIVVILQVWFSLQEALYWRSSQTMVKRNLAVLTEIMDLDIKQINYNVLDTLILTPFLVAASNEIIYMADTDNNGVIDTLHYYVGPVSELSHTENPNDRNLYRKINSGTPLMCGSGVTSLNFFYYDSSGTATTILTNIRSVGVRIIMEDGYSVNNQYARSIWEKTIIPPNL